MGNRDAPGPELSTGRLVLRRWRAADREPFGRLNSSDTVMTFLGGPLDRRASDALADRIQAHFDHRGFGLWAVEVAGGPAFIGFVGLAAVELPAPFTPAVEVGWRLAEEQWGRGYATEAGRAAVDYAFSTLALDEIVSFTAVGNVRSRAVMDRVGLVRDPGGDFDHPRVATGSPLRAHVLYRARRDEWRS